MKTKSEPNQPSERDAAHAARLKGNGGRRKQEILDRMNKMKQNELDSWKFPHFEHFVNSVKNSGFELVM
jgi:hypothetical protein